MSTATEVAKLCIQLATKQTEYDAMQQPRAHAEVDWKQAKAVFIQRALLDGAKSMAAAENAATADDDLAGLWRAHLVLNGEMDACGRSMRTLSTRIDYGRSVIATERAADSLHSQGYSGAA